MEGGGPTAMSEQMEATSKRRKYKTGSLPTDTRSGKLMRPNVARAQSKLPTKTRSPNMKSRTISEKGRMTTGQMVLMEKKNKLYREAQSLPLWGIRKITINPNDKDDLIRFADNSVSTTRYKWWNFLPVNLWHQFQRVPTAWILVVSIIQFFPIASVHWGPWAFAGPLLTVIVLTTFRDAWEDVLKWKRDCRVNNRSCFVFDTKLQRFESRPWKNLRAGNVVEVRMDQELPADCVLLSVKNSTGVAHIETTTLTGENTLKKKSAGKDTRDACDSEAIKLLRGRIACEQPTSSLESFNGTLKRATYPRGCSMNLSNFLPRGSTLRDTELIYGCVVYCGHDTRIMKACGAPVIKRSFLEEQMNLTCAIGIGFVIAADLVCWLGWYISLANSYYYLSVFQGYTYRDVHDAVSKFLQYTVLFALIVPVTAFLSLDLVKWLQGLFISYDAGLTAVDDEDMRVEASAYHSSLNDTLGQVDFVLADKTGTMTKNQMQFAMCSIDGRIYGRGKNRKCRHNDRNEPRCPYSDSGIQCMNQLYDDSTSDTDVADDTLGSNVWEDVAREATLIVVPGTCDCGSSPISRTTASRHGGAHDQFPKKGVTFKDTVEGSIGNRLSLDESGRLPQGSSLGSSEWSGNHSSNLTKSMTQESEYGEIDAEETGKNLTNMHMRSNPISSTSFSSHPYWMDTTPRNDSEESDHTNLDRTSSNELNDRDLEQLATLRGLKGQTDDERSLSNGSPHHHKLPKHTRFADDALMGAPMNISDERGEDEEIELYSPEVNALRRVSCRMSRRSITQHQSLIFTGDSDTSEESLSNIACLSGVNDIFFTSSNSFDGHGVNSPAMSNGPQLTDTATRRGGEGADQCEEPNGDGAPQNIEAANHRASGLGQPRNAAFYVAPESISSDRDGDEASEEVVEGIVESEHHDSKAILRGAMVSLPDNFRKGYQKYMLFNDRSILKDLKGPLGSFDNRSERVYSFLKAMAICNTVSPYVLLDDDEYKTLFPDASLKKEDMIILNPLSPIVHPVSPSTDTSFAPTAAQGQRLSATVCQTVHTRSTSHSTSSARDSINSPEHSGGHSRASWFPQLRSDEKSQYDIAKPRNSSRQRFVLESRERAIQYDLDRIQYQCSFPDEGCLVRAASLMGFTLTRRAPKHVNVDINGVVQKIHVMGSFEPSAGRQRMVLVVRDPITGEGTLYMKGTDEGVVKFITASSERIEQMTRQVARFSRRGLRTMVFAQRKMTVEETKLFESMFSDARDSVYDREPRKLKVVEAFESNLDLLGIAGIRDTLQENVSQTIETLAAARIRAWMLTGDSSQHAIQTAHSAHMIRSNSVLFIAELHSERKPRAEAHDMYHIFKRERADKSTEHMCIVTSGPTLEIMLSSPEMSGIFLSMAICCDSVLCCQLTSEQKGEVAKLIRTKLTPTPIVLGIGDGLNDIPLLHECHVGVAVLSGNRKLPLVESAADFFIPRFHHLRRLLLVHGRQCLMRNSTLALWFMFRSILFAVPVMLFQIISQWSTAPMYFANTGYMLFCLFGTIPTAIIHGVCEEDVPARVLEHVPVLYILGRRRLYYSPKQCGMWIGEAILMSLVCYFFSVSAINGAPLAYTVQRLSTLVFTAVYFTSVWRILLESHTLSLLMIAAGFIFPILIYTAWLLGTGIFNDGPIGFWAAIPAALMANSTIYFIFQLLRAWLLPNIAHEISDALKAAEAKHAEEYAKMHPVVFNGDWPKVWKPSLVGHPPIMNEMSEQFHPNSATVRAQLPPPRCFQTRFNVKESHLRRHYSRHLTGYSRSSHSRAMTTSASSHALRCRDPSYPSSTPSYPIPSNSRSQQNQESTEDLRNSPPESGNLPCAGDEEGRLAKKSVKLNLPIVDHSYGSGGEFETDRHPKTNQTDRSGRSTARSHVSVSSYYPPYKWGFDPSREIFHESTDGDNDDAHSMRGDDEGGSGYENDDDVEVIKRVMKASDLIKRFSLKFNDEQLEADYQVDRRQDLRVFRWWYRMVILSLLFMHITAYPFLLDFVETEIKTDVYSIIIHLVAMTVLISYFLSTWFRVFVYNFDLITGIVLLTILVSCGTGFTQYGIAAFVVILTSAVFPVTSHILLRIPFLHSVFYNFIFVVIFIIRVVVHRRTETNAHYVPLILGVEAFTLFAGYRLTYNHRKRYLLDYQGEASRRKQREILNTMLPPFVVAKMLNSRVTKDGIPSDIGAEQSDVVTVIFCDIFDFQNVVASVDATRLVEVLDTLFLCFDRVADQFGITKVETVFETYLSAAGLQFETKEDDPSASTGSRPSGSRPSSPDSHYSTSKYGRQDKQDNINSGRSNPPEKHRQAAGDAIDMGLSMLEVASYIKYEVINKKTNHDERGSSEDESSPSYGGHHCDADAQSVAESLRSRTTRASLNDQQPRVFQTKRIQVKIGMNSGTVISGVVGVKKPQYALFGDTVNTASRMKTTGAPDNIHCSGSTFALVEHDKSLSWEPRTITVKGKGDMNTFLLKTVAGNYYPDYNRRGEQHREAALGEIGGDDGERKIFDVIRSAQVKNGGEGRRRYSTAADSDRGVEHSAHSSVGSLGGSLLNPNTASTQKRFSIAVVPGHQGGSPCSAPSRQASAYNLRNSGMHQAAHPTDTSSDNSVSCDETLPLSPAHSNKTGLSQGGRVSHRGGTVNRTENYSENPAKARPFMTDASHQAPPNPHAENESEASSRPRPTAGEPSGPVNGESRQGRIAGVLADVNRSMRRVSMFYPRASVDHVAQQTYTHPVSPTSPASQSPSPSRKSWTLFGNLKQLRTDDGNDEESSKHDDAYIHPNQIDDENPDSEPSSNKVQLNLATLSFKDPEKEAAYRSYFYSNKSNINTIEQALIIFMVAFVIDTMILLAVPKMDVEIRNPVVFWMIRSGYLVTACLFWTIFHYRNKTELFGILSVPWAVFALNLLFVSASLTFMLSNSWAYLPPTEANDEGIEWFYVDAMEFFFFITIIHHNTGLHFFSAAFSDVLLFIMSYTFIFTVTIVTPAAQISAASIFMYFIFNILSSYIREYIDRSTWSANEEMQIAEMRASELLNDMLPKQVLEEFQSDQLKLAYTHEEITFLFADICGFTAYAKSVQPWEVVTLLQQLFAKFDRDSTRFGLYKLCTIGDAYVAVSDPTTTKDSCHCQHEQNPSRRAKTKHKAVANAEKVLQMAHAMISQIMEVRTRLNIPGLNMRIGLHYGRCVGGVIGSGRLRYDLWGMDVLTGNMMESNGKPGAICVSEPLKDFIEANFKRGRYLFEEHKVVEVIEKEVLVNSYMLVPGDVLDSNDGMSKRERSKRSLPKKNPRATLLGAVWALGAGKGENPLAQPIRSQSPRAEMGCELCVLLRAVPKCVLCS
eukprot:GHVN01067189.1.p1 GENE.GHVN01067189.1~~GHVN01067189.1.p1  ORF type:complete len:3341 (+),score=384.02 GHVN01067189.1:158-10180(+)